MAKAKPKTAPATKPKAAPAKSQAAQRAQQVAKQTSQESMSAWDRARMGAKSGRGGTNVPDGKYTCQLTAADLKDVADGTKIKWTGTVINDPDGNDGGIVERWSPLLESDDDQQLGYLLRDFYVLGVDTDNPEFTPESITQEFLDDMIALNPMFECAVVTKGAYTNAYFNAPITADDDSAGGPMGAAAPEVDPDEPEDVPEDADEPLAEDDSCTYMAAGVERGGVVVRFEDGGNKTIIRDDESGKSVRVPTNKVTKGAAT